MEDQPIATTEETEQVEEVVDEQIEDVVPEKIVEDISKQVEVKFDEEFLSDEKLIITSENSEKLIDTLKIEHFEQSDDTIIQKPEPATSK
jgi:hypothetical protein